MESFFIKSQKGLIDPEKLPTEGGHSPKTSEYSRIITDIFREDSLIFTGLNGINSSELTGTFTDVTAVGRSLIM